MHKTCNIFVLKVKKLDEELIDIDFGTLVKDCKLLKIRTTRMKSIVVGCSGTVIMYWLLVKNKFSNIGGNN